MLILPIAFIGMLLVSFSLMAVVSRPSAHQKVVQKRLGVLALTTAQARALEANAVDLLKQPRGEGRLAQLDAFLNKFDFYPKLELLIRQAHRDTTPGKVVMTSAGLGLAGVFATHLFVPQLLAQIAAPLVLAAFPLCSLRFQRGRRLKKFDLVLADSIDLMSRALKAGHSVASAIEVVAQEGPEPVASEFAEVFRSQNFGLPFRDALLELSERVPSKDLRFLVTAMMVQKETGGNLTEILDRTTHVIRERVRIHGEVKTKTAQGKLTGVILSLLPVILGVLINLVNPGYAAPLFHDPLGKKMLYAAAGLISLGGFIISKIVQIEV